MAKYIENFKSKLDWSNVLQRTAAVPLDRTELFESLADATLYAQGGADARNLSGTSYIGQIVVVHENDAVTAYIIENKVAESFDAEGKETNKSTRTLKELAGAEAAAGDVKSALQKLNEHITAYTTKVEELEDADSGLQNALDGEIARAKAAEEANANAIASEETRATTAEKGLEGRLDVIEGEDTVTGSIKKAVADLRTELLGTGSLVEEETQEHKTLLSLERAIEDLDQSGTDEANARIAADTQLAGMLGVQITAEGVVTKVALPVTSDADGAVAAKDVVEAITQLDARLDKLQGAETVEGSVAKAVADEADARIAADNSLDARLDIIEGEANVEGSIKKALADAKAHAEEQDVALKAELKKEIDDDVKVEKDRAELAEKGLQDAIKAEADRAKAAEEALHTVIGTVEGALPETDLDGETVAAQLTDAGTRVKALEDDLATQKDATKDGLAKQIATEKARAEGAEQDLQDAIDDLADSVSTTVENVIGDLTGTGLQDKEAEGDGLNKTVAKQLTQAHADIVAEAEAARAAEKTLTDNLAAEVTRAKGVEADLAQDIADEIARVGAIKDVVVVTERNEDGSVKNQETKTPATVIEYVDTKVAALVDAAPEAMDTLQELAKAIKDNKGVYDGYIAEHAEAMAKLKTDLQKEIDDDVKALADRHDQEMDAAEGRLDAIEAKLADGGAIEQRIQNAEDAIAAHQALVGNLPEDAAEGTTVVSMIQAVDAELTKQKDATKDGLAKQIATEKARAEGAEQELQEQITALKGKGEGSVVDQIAAAKTELDGKITTLKGDMVETFNALDLNWVEGATPKIEIKLDSAKTGIDTVLGDVEVPVLTEDELTAMLDEILKD